MKISKERVVFGGVTTKDRGHRFRAGDKVLKPDEIILVRVASFVFRFRSVEQLKECLTFFEKKIHPSSLVSEKELTAQLGEDWREQRGWEVERWFERLPMYLLEEPKREKVLKVLRKALVLEETGKLRS